jgi:hypothetical protein
MRLHHPRARQAATAVALALIAVTLAACATDLDMPSPPPSGSPAATPTAIPSAPDPTPVPTAPSQTDTEWGRIWDALPDGFPGYPGWTPTETGGGPASGVFDVGTEDPEAVIHHLEQGLDAAGMSTDSLDGPREDGSWQLEAVSAFDPACRIQVTATPMGASTIVEVMYGAACPFE